MAPSPSQRAASTPYLPPWLWLWIVLFMVSLPDGVDLFRQQIAELRSVAANSEAYGTPLAPFLITPGIMELVPTLALALGILAIALPDVRCRIEERKWQLRTSDSPPPAVREIESFVHRHVPGLGIRTNLALTRELAFVYPTSFRRSALALFGGLVILWRRDRPAAEAVLLHEIAHYRHGDGLATGAGSLLETTLRRWWLLILATTVLPLVVLWLDMTVRTVIEWRALLAPLHGLATEIEASGLELPDLPELGLADLLSHKFMQFSTVILPGFLAMVLALTLWTAAIFVVPIVAIWCCELDADRFAIATESAPGALARTIARAGSVGSISGWLLRRISHPPAGLRLWLARRATSWWSTLILLLVFPLAYGLRLLLLIAHGAAVHLSTGLGLGSLPAQIPLWAGTYLRQLSPKLALAALLVLAWPWLASAWMRLRAAGARQVDRSAYPAYALAALSLGALALPWSLTILETAPQPEVTTTQELYRADEPIVVRFAGLPGNAQDWISVVAADATAEVFGDWQFTEGHVAGELALPPRPPGHYEARVYFDWPAGGFEIQARARFQVDAP